MKQVCGVMIIVLTFAFNAIASPQSTFDQKITELGQQIAKGMTENQKKTIAVIEFADLRGNVTDFGRFLAEELITQLYQTKKFKVIERQLLKKVIAEQKLSLTGVMDQNAAKQLGRLLGVDAIASGTVTELPNSLRINARLISTETGELFAVASTEIIKDELTSKLMGSGTTSDVTNTTKSSSNPVDQPSDKRHTRRERANQPSNGTSTVESVTPSPSNEIGQTKSNDFYEITLENAKISSKTNCNLFASPQAKVSLEEKAMIVRFTITRKRSFNKTVNTTDYLIVDAQNTRFEPACGGGAYYSYESEPKTIELSYVVPKNSNGLKFRFQQVGAGDPITFVLPN